MRPFVHINCAMSADGKIAGMERKQIRISSDEDKARVRSLRSWPSASRAIGLIIRRLPARVS